MAGLPRLVDGIQFEPMDDGFIVLRESEDRVHFLNGTATLVMALCDGTNSVADIAAMLQRQYGLAQPPMDDVASLLGKLGEEGLVVVDRQLASEENDS